LVDGVACVAEQPLGADLEGRREIIEARDMQMRLT
jgi:hypothetical protein